MKTIPEMMTKGFAYLDRIEAAGELSTNPFSILEMFRKQFPDIDRATALEIMMAWVDKK